jgi:hypothetical protein
MSQRVAVVVLAAALAACAGRAPGTPAPVAPPDLVIGVFRDDYGSTYRLSDTLFEHLPRARYRIVEWQPSEQFFIAQNDSGNPGEPGRWTRVDWMPLPAMAPWEWGFCLTAWNAASADAARATPSADRSNPRSGCGGHPFTRMQRVQ